jgi:hypothetical protein
MLLRPEGNEIKVQGYKKKLNAVISYEVKWNLPYDSNNSISNMQYYEFKRNLPCQDCINS